MRRINKIYSVNIFEKIKEKNQVVNALESGGVIAYPTDTVYGLGCDPKNKAAVERLLDIKERPVDM